MDRRLSNSHKYARLGENKGIYNTNSLDHVHSHVPTPNFAFTVGCQVMLGTFVHTPPPRQRRGKFSYTLPSLNSYT